jgi:hypothetical protein
MSDRIDELAALVASQIQPLIGEARDQIHDALNAAVEEAQEGEGKAILSLSISVKWDLDANTVTVALPVSVKRRFEAVARLEDKNQVKMNL